MLENQKFQRATAVGPLGEPLTLANLPSPHTNRWVVRRKAEVVAAVSSGLLTIDEACQRYSLSLDEFNGWKRAFDQSGMPGLRVTRINQNRNKPIGRPIRIEALEKCSIAREDGRLLSAVLVNLSEGGFCFTSNDRVEVGERIELCVPGMGRFAGCIRWSHNNCTGGVFEPYVQGAFERCF